MTTFPLRDDLLSRSQVNALKQISQACSKANCEFFLIGAFARDIILKVVHNQDPPRATTDIDFAICTSDWDSFARVIESLVDDHMLSRTRSEQRYVSSDGVIVDLIPFGGIEEPDGEVSFPPTDEVVLSTIGFAEAHRGAITFSLKNDHLSFRVASLPGICLLKLISWSERPYQRQKDVDDIAYIIRHYFDLANDDELYSQHSDQILRDDFDQTLVGGRILGRHIGHQLSETDLFATITTIVNEVIDAGIDGQFVEQMTTRILDVNIGFQSIVELRAGLDETVNV